MKPEIDKWILRRRNLAGGYSKHNNIVAVFKEIFRLNRICINLFILFFFSPKLLVVDYYLFIFFTSLGITCVPAVRAIQRRRRWCGTSGTPAGNNMTAPTGRRRRRTIRADRAH